MTRAEPAASGAAAESRAARFLEQRGLSMVERNYRCRFGEIDLIMRDGRTLVFVEVRMRQRADFGGAAASITTAKQAKLVATAQHYLAQHGNDVPCRFDALLIESDAIEWIKDAFGTN